MRSLTEKEWKEIQELVKKKDKEQSNHIGVNFFKIVVLIKNNQENDE
jgi:hypothetical protein